MITSIPDHIRAQFPRIVADAIADGLRCEPADRPRAEAGLRTIYRCAGLNPNVPIIWVESPLEGALASSIAAATLRSSDDTAVYSAVDSAIHSAIDSAVNLAVNLAVRLAVNLTVHSAVNLAVESAIGSAIGSAVDSAAHAAVYSTVDSAIHSAIDSAIGRRLSWHARRGGQFWIYWPAYVETIMKLGVDHSSFVALRAEADVCRSAGWYWPNANFIMISERPRAIRRDAEGRLHSENGPAIDYGETFRLYSWHGTSIPAAWIEQKSQLSPDVALTWENIEQRRAAQQIIGWDKILNELQATKIDANPDPEIGTLYRVELPDVGPTKILRVRCGTGRVFAMPVPMSIRSARHAQAWMVGQRTKDWKKPEVRT